MPNWKQTDLFQSISSRLAIRVSRSAQPTLNEKGQKIRDTSGQTSSDSSENADLLWCFSRMLRARFDAVSMKFGPIWKIKTTPLGRSIFQLRLSEPRTAVNASGLSDSIQWPTPRASEYKDCGPVGSKSWNHWNTHYYLAAMVKDSTKPTGKLNPRFVEWLMGFPQEWTRLKL